MSIYDDLPNSLGGFTDSTQLVQIQGRPDITVDAAIVDRIAAPALARAPPPPTLSPSSRWPTCSPPASRCRTRVATRAGTDLLGTPDLGLPDVSGFGAFTTLLAATPGLRPTTLDELGVRTDQLLGSEGRGGEPAHRGGGRHHGAHEPGHQAGTRGGQHRQHVAAGDPRIAEWNRLVSVLPTMPSPTTRPAASPTICAPSSQTLRDSVVVPTGFSFNLTGAHHQRAHHPEEQRRHPAHGAGADEFVQAAGSPTATRPSTLPPQVVPRGERRRSTPVSNGTTGVTLEVFTPVGDVRAGHHPCH